MFAWDHKLLTFSLQQEATSRFNCVSFLFTYLNFFSGSPISDSIEGGAGVRRLQAPVRLYDLQESVFVEGWLQGTRQPVSLLGKAEL